MTTTLDEVHALTHVGSLLSGEGAIVAPYDLEVSGNAASGFTSLHACDAIRRAPFAADYSLVRRVHLINAFGVTLGDSIIGLTALVAIKRRYPHLKFTILSSRLRAALRAAYLCARGAFVRWRDRRFAGAARASSRR